LIARRKLLVGLAASTFAIASCKGGAHREAKRPKPMPGRRIVVVGAGIAGLAAAKRLRESGAEIVVVDALDRVGGRVYSVRTPAWDGAQELGAQFLNDHYTSLLPLFGSSPSDTGEPPVALLSGLTATIVDGRAVTVDAFNPRTYIARGVIDTSDALAVGIAFADVASGVRTLPLDDFGRWEAEDGESALSWASRSYGPRATDYIAAPSIEGLFFTRPSELSAAAFKWMIANADRAGRWYTSPASNFAAATSLMKRLASSGVRFVLGNAVGLVDQDAARRVRVSLASGEVIVADGAVVTAPGALAHRLLRSPGRAQTGILTEEYAATIVVNVVVDHPDADLRRNGHVYGVNVPRVESPNGRIAAFSVESGKTNLPHGGRELYGFHLRDEAARALMDRSDEAIVQEVVGEAQRWVPSIRSGFVDAVVQRWPIAIPKMRVGHAARCRELWRDQAQLDTRILIAGDQTSVSTMDGAAWSGLRAAELLEAKLTA
jgi:oxygen-dependent protoporphyrinogen oxidase